MTGGKGYRVTMDKVSKVMADIKAMTADDLLVGVPMGENKRKDSMGNAAIAYLNEYGSAAQNIPARPFLVPGVEAVGTTITAEMAKGLAKGFDKPGAMAQHMNRAGLQAVLSVKKHIVALGNYPADSPTVQARKAKGFKGTGILRVTGQLINSITYVVKSNKGGK